MKRATIIFCGLTAMLMAAAGCSDVKRTPGKVYMPDMANSRAYETYSVNPVFADAIVTNAVFVVKLFTAFV